METATSITARQQRSAAGATAVGPKAEAATGTSIAKNIRIEIETGNRKKTDRDHHHHHQSIGKKGGKKGVFGFSVFETHQGTLSLKGSEPVWTRIWVLLAVFLTPRPLHQAPKKVPMDRAGLRTTKKVEH
jgi:hypothetical protein